jgi:hypothetical protein
VNGLSAVVRWGKSKEKTYLLGIHRNL